MLKPALAIALLASLASPALAAPNQLTREQIYQRQCAAILNFLPSIVPKGDVAAIPANAHVAVHNICTGVSMNSFGNVVGLTRTIAANHALARALARRGYNADQVVGIQIQGNSVQLYVHQD